MDRLKELGATIRKIDILSPPKQYITEVLQVICDCFGYRFGSVIKVDAHGNGHMISAYNLPQDYPEQGGRERAQYLSDFY